MANTPRTVDLIDDSLSHGIGCGILHLQAEDESLDGRTVQIRGKPVLQFASCSYLGLELDPRLREGVVEAVGRYGTQFSSSRAYLSAPAYEELEELLERIFDAPVVVSSSTTLAHLAALPVLVQEDDAVILDHQVHQSVQLAARQLKLQGTTVEMVRHNGIERLDAKIRKLSESHRKVWYMADGVYSMYGEFAPVKALSWLLGQHEKLNLYVDDAHGMSWCGRNGRGFAAEAFAGHERVVVAVSLNKSFACAGGALVLPDAETRRRIRTCGSTIIFGGPIQPPMLGAAMASARIHLSPEIETLQRELRERIAFANQTARELDLPIVRMDEVPIRYMGASLRPAAFDMVARLLDLGVCTNAAAFPAVGSRRAGVRFTITRHQTEGDIRRALEAMAEVLPEALATAGLERADVDRAFGLAPTTRRPAAGSPAPTTQLSLRHERSIMNLDAQEWDACLGGRGVFDAATLGLFETTFGPHQPPESRWDFHYFVVRDADGHIVLATFFTEALWKDDLLSESRVSQEVERRRSDDPYFLTSRTLSMGTLLSEGDHLYLDRSRDWRGALRLLFAALEEVRAECDAPTVVMRDIAAEDEELGSALADCDFLRVTAPDTWVIDVDWKSRDEFMSKLASHERRYHRRNVLHFEKAWELEVVQNGTRRLGTAEWEHLNGLYRNVQQRQLALNTFPLPGELLPGMLETPGWELLLLRLQPEHGGHPGSPPQGFVACHFGEGRYDWLLVGMDYDYVESHGLYRQLVARVVQRAEALGASQVGLGMSSERVKKRFRAHPEQRVMYVQSIDSYNHDLLELVSADSRVRTTG